MNAVDCVPAPGGTDPMLERRDGVLQLVDRENRRGVHLDLTDLRRRLRQGRRLALARACGVSGERIRVLDAMAGLGLDGLTLACLGCDVLMVERNALLAELLADAIARVRAAITVEGSMDVRHADARDVLDEAAPVDCVYFDPMFPARTKTALARRSAQMLAQLNGPVTDDLSAFVAAALPLAKRRVVVKRRRLDPPVVIADWRVVGRSVRFDVYRGRGRQF